MQFTYDGELYKVIRVTGPSHNLLGISFANSESKSLDIEVLQIDGEKRESILADNVKEQVLLGINEINEELNTNYKLKKIQFLTSDTLSEDIYKELVKELVKQIESKRGFKSI